VRTTFVAEIKQYSVLCAAREKKLAKLFYFCRSLVNLDRARGNFFRFFIAMIPEHTTCLRARLPIDGGRCAG